MTNEERDHPKHTEQSIDRKRDDPDQEFPSRMDLPLVCNILIEHQPRGDPAQKQPRTDDVVPRLCRFRDWQTTFFKERKIGRVILFPGLGHCNKIPQQAAKQQTSRNQDQTLPPFLHPIDTSFSGITRL